MWRKLIVFAVFIVLYIYIGILQSKEGPITLRENRVSKTFITKFYKDVMTDDGVVRGWEDDEEYYAYYGVPYAGVPSGRRKFLPPATSAPYDGINYGKIKIKCPQRGTGDPDCLVLNIFTPKVITNLLPVLVYLHGGSFLIGAAQTKGLEPLMKENIIVLTVNYRLGPLGFLCLGVDDACGNQGLKDQLAALKWIKKNIIHFGGDHKKVTLYGMSAGAASVEYHILANSSKGLFQRAVIESGSANSVFALDPTPIATAKELANLLKFDTAGTVSELVRQYQNVSVDVLTEVNYDYYNNKTNGLFGFAPCVESHECTGSYITESPNYILRNNKFDKVPLMVLYTSLEGLYLNSEKFYEAGYPNRMDSNFAEFLPGDLHFETDVVKEEVADMVKKFYFGNETIGLNSVKPFLNYFGDMYILHALLDSVKYHSKDNPVYLMEFAYKGKMGSHEDFYANIELAGHGDVIKHAMLLKPIQDDKDELTVDRVAKLIANFVKLGNPTPGPTKLLPVSWPAVQPGNLSYLHLDEEFQILTNPYPERMELWDNLYSKYRRGPVKPVDPDDFYGRLSYFS